MVDLRSAADIRKVVRPRLGAAAGVDPNLITDASRIYQAPPPGDNLNLAQTQVKGLVESCARELVGRTIADFLAADLLPPDALRLQTFGSLADALHVHFNSLVLSAVFITVCEGLVVDPRTVGAETPITHLDEAGRLSFMMRVRDSVRVRICNRGTFEFTQTRGTSLMDARNVEAAMDATVGGLKDAMPGNNCI